MHQCSRAARPVRAVGASPQTWYERAQRFFDTRLVTRLAPYALMNDRRFCHAPCPDRPTDSQWLGRAIVGMFHTILRDRTATGGYNTQNSWPRANSDRPPCETRSSLVVRHVCLGSNEEAWIVMPRFGILGNVAAVWVGLASASAASAGFGGSPSVFVVVQDAPDTGNSSITVAPGEEFSVWVNITGDAGFESESFGLDLAARGLALDYRGYSLPPPVFITGGVNDFSDLTSLHFEALTDNAGEVFSSGPLVKLDLTASSDPGGGVSTVDVIDGFFNCGFSGCNVISGETFTVNVTPEPATLLLLSLGGVAALRRRNSAT